MVTFGLNAPFSWFGACTKYVALPQKMRAFLANSSQSVGIKG
jgi:hypothetical protein